MQRGITLKRILMFPHVGSKNHGCEAIILATEKLFSEWEIVVFSNAPEEDYEYIRDSHGIIVFNACGIDFHCVPPCV